MSKLLKTHRASLTPSFVLIVMALVVIGSYFFCLMVVYENRLIIRNAMDAAVTSALAGGCSAERIETEYDEYDLCLGGNETTPCTVVWFPSQSNSKNYIYVDQSKASAVAKDYLNRNLKINLSSAEYEIKNFSLSCEYDSERYLEVTSDRDHTGAPNNWWKYEFGDSSPSIGANGSGMVRFPRWVKVTVSATVEIKIPLSKLLGDNGKMEFSWQSEAIKELKEVDEP